MTNVEKLLAAYDELVAGNVYVMFSRTGARWTVTVHHRSDDATTVLNSSESISAESAALQMLGSLRAALPTVDNIIKGDK